MKMFAFAAVALMSMSATAVADDWSGTPINPVPPPSSVPGFSAIDEDANARANTILPGVPQCFNGGSGLFFPPPCTPGETPTLVGTQSHLTSPTLPAGAAAPNSSVGIMATGWYPDPSAPAGVSFLNSFIPLSAFASSSAFDALQANVTTGFANVQAQINALNTQFSVFESHFNQVIRLQARENSSGVAQAFAVAGTSDLQSDENFAVSFNLGTYGGQTAIAAGAAARVDDHVSFNAGFTSNVNGGMVGARAGIRFGW